MFQVWGSRASVCNTSASKLSARAIHCVFLGFVPDAPGWLFYDPTSRRIFPSQDITFDESVPFYRLFLYRSAPPPPPPLFLAPGPPPVAVSSGAARGSASWGAASGGAEPGGAESEGAGVGVLSLGVRSQGVLSLRVWSLGVLSLKVLSLGVLSRRVRSLGTGISRRSLAEWKSRKSELEGAHVAHMRLHGRGRAPWYRVMELKVDSRILAYRKKCLAVSVGRLQKWSHEVMKIMHPEVKWAGSQRWTERILLTMEPHNACEDLGATRVRSYLQPARLLPTLPCRPRACAARALHALPAHAPLLPRHPSPTVATAVAATPPATTAPKATTTAAATRVTSNAFVPLLLTATACHGHYHGCSSIWRWKQQRQPETLSPAVASQVGYSARPLWC
ncbi:unnamed protein product [Closterium sp. NIES-54]